MPHHDGVDLADVLKCDDVRSLKYVVAVESKGSALLSDFQRAILRYYAMDESLRWRVTWALYRPDGGSTQQRELQSARLFFGLKLKAACPETYDKQRMCSTEEFG